MLHIKPPQFVNNILRNKLFLAGSIEMGNASNWQERVAVALKDTDYTILNPRRDDWNLDWVQDINNPYFYDQVSWELQGLEVADKVLFYFEPLTVSPISLMELGLVASNEPECAIVVCPEGYARKGNVDIVCERYGIKQISDLEVAMTNLYMSSNARSRGESE